MRGFGCRTQGVRVIAHLLRRQRLDVAPRHLNERPEGGSMMTVESKARELCVVDNSVSGRTSLRYLEE